MVINLFENVYPTCCSQDRGLTSGDLSMMNESLDFNGQDGTSLTPQWLV